MRALSMPGSDSSFQSFKFWGCLKWNMIDVSEDNSSLVKDLKSVFPLCVSKVYSSKNIHL